LPNPTRSNRPVKAVAPPVRPPDADTTPPPSVTLVVPAEGAVATFARLADAVAARDYRTATAVRRQLYRSGWSIIPPGTASRAGRWP
jgi:hypothetical protein